MSRQAIQAFTPTYMQSAHEQNTDDSFHQRVKERHWNSVSKYDRTLHIYLLATVCAAASKSFTPSTAFFNL